LRLYLETTVFNYYFDEDRDGHEDTVRLFESIGNGEYEAYTSIFATIEILKAHDPKKTNMMDLIEKYKVNILESDGESMRIANLYIQNGIIPIKYRLDAVHIAIASVNGLDCVMSFNYKHINKLKTKRMVENINLIEGYKGITICTPMEVLD
jgi:predicted nucleic acid-binding protein